MKRLFRIIFIALVCMMSFSLTACSKEAIMTPTDLSIDEDNNLIWNSVNDAKQYIVYFHNVDTNTTTQGITRKNSYSLSELEEGDYEITVQAVSGDDDKKDSNQSEAMIYHKYKETGCVYKLINNNTEYAISKVGSATGTFVIEDYYRGKAVTEVSDKAFKGSSKVVDITLGENIITIGDSAFWNCSKLERIFIPNSVISIGKSCFQSCRALSEVRLSENLSNIPDYCFAYCRSIININLPSSITSIGEGAFINATALESIDVPEKVESINPSAFYGCELLGSVNIGKGIVTIDESAFNACHNLTSVTFNTPSNLKTIGESAFKDCFKLPNITLPKGLETIGDTCFNNSSALSAVTIPDTVTSVGGNAFVGTKLFKDQVDNGDNFIYADTWLIYCPSTVKSALEEINTTTLKDGIVGIADNVFLGCEKLKIITLPQSFKYIGKHAFEGCSALWKLITLEDSILIIDDYAFNGCNLSNVSLGYGLKRIGHFAFYANPNLDNNELTPYDWIPESVTSIGKGAFKNTMIYTKAMSGSGICYAGNWAVGLASPITTIDLKFDPDHVAGIADYAFMYEGFEELASVLSIRSISGLSSCRYIGVGAFYGNVELSSISLNRNLTEIREAAFYKTGLIKATFPRSLDSIGAYAFSNTSLTSLDLSGTNVKSIGKSAFAEISGLTEVLFNDKLETIDDYAFYNCNNILSIELPDTVTKIGENAFYGLESMKTLKVSNSLTEIEDGAFAHCLKLETVTGLDSVKTIGKEAFYLDESIKSIDLGDNVESIGDAAFYQNKSLEYIYLPNGIKSLGVYTFQGCNSLKTIVIPSTLRTIGQHAFYECFNLTIYTSMLEKASDWHNRYNSSNRTVFFGSTLDEGNNVLSIVVSNDTLQYKNALNGVNPPVYLNKTFKHWVDNNSITYNMDDIFKIEDNITLSAVYE